jgi:hypothetical protein
MQFLFFLHRILLFFRISNSENPTKKPTFAGSLPSWKDKNKTNQTKDNSL